MALKPKPKGETESATIVKKCLKGDSMTVTMAAGKDGKIKLTNGSLDGGSVTALPGQVIEARWYQGQVLLTIRERGKKLS